jgi:hypothetical protein
MTPHGFTKEHNLPRGHTFALLDQYVVDRAFGGRFGTKESWRYLAGTGDFKVWDMLDDLYPDNTDQKAFLPGTAAAANPVCLSCKTQDHILEWAYMGDPVPGAKWSRTSKVVELAKASQHSLNCIFCHDPHVKARPVHALTSRERTDSLTLTRRTRAGPRSTSGTGARLHAQDRPAGALRRQAGAGNATSSTTAIRASILHRRGYPMADKRTTHFVRRRQQHPEGLRRIQFMISGISSPAAL